MAYYQANTASPLFADLRALLLKTAGLTGVLADALKPFAAKLRAAFVYESIASGDERSDSDIDVIIVGNIPPAELALPLRRAGEVLGREIHPTIYTPAEFNRKRAEKNRFWAHVLDKPKMFLMGTTHALDQVTQ